MKRSSYLIDHRGQHPVRRVLGVAVSMLLMITAMLLPAAAASADSAPRRIVAGWIRPAPYQEAGVASVTANADLWSEVSPFWYSVTGATTV
ncbi:MAG TPA: hypothetical protein VFP34_15160, partial [Microlunatus sp.]|nr:hypothetical protein [Microlunatus sp.]